MAQGSAFWAWFFTLRIIIRFSWKIACIFSWIFPACVTWKYTAFLKFLSLFFSVHIVSISTDFSFLRNLWFSRIYLGFSLLENRILWRWGYLWKIYSLSSAEITEGIHNPMSSLSKSSLCEWTYQGFNPSKALTKGYLDTKLTFSQEPLFPETETSNFNTSCNPPRLRSFWIIGSWFLST